MFKPNPRIKDYIKNKLAKSLEQSSVVLQKKVINNAPVDSGKLKKSIKIDTSKITDLEVSVKAEVPYAAAVEFGSLGRAPNPFFRSAIQESKSKMLKEFKDIL